MLLEGQTIKMTADDFACDFGIWCICGDCDEAWEDVNANDTVEFTADHACVYNTWGYYEQEPHLKAEMPEMTKVNTDAELKAKEAGTHVCLVTFDGCRYEVSDEVEVCTHMCHQGGFLGFFWNIINFFNKLFGLNPFCGCGVAHY